MRSPSKPVAKSIRDAEADLNLPPGFRFHPTDEELIVHYLSRKSASTSKIIADIDLYKHEPWDLPEMALFGTNEWYFFTPRDRKYPNGSRPNRTTRNGYWKATGVDKPIKSKSDSNATVGIKKALVFYAGKGSKGIKTNWIMHEYRLDSKLDDWVLCRLYNKKNNPKEMIELQDNNDHSTIPSGQPQKENSNSNSNSNNSDSLNSFEYSNEVEFSGNFEDNVIFLDDLNPEYMIEVKGTNEERDMEQKESLMQKDEYGNDWLDSLSLEDLHHCLEAMPPNNLDIFEMPMVYNSDQHYFSN